MGRIRTVNDRFGAGDLWHGSCSSWLDDGEVNRRIEPMEKFLVLFIMLGLVAPVQAEWFGGKKKAKKQKQKQTQVVSRARTKKHEVLVSATAADFNISNNTNIRVEGGYNYAVTPYLQLGGNLGIGLVEVSGVSITTFTFLAGTTLNLPFDKKIEDSFFVFTKLGFIHQSVSPFSVTEFVISFGGGKRFKIFENLSYRPEMGLRVITNNDPVFFIKLLSAGIHF